MMARVSPYYSAKPSSPDAYHNHDDCSAGSKVVGHNRRKGTHRYRQCDECVALSEQLGEFDESHQERGFSFDEPATASGA